MARWRTGGHSPRDNGGSPLLHRARSRDLGRRVCDPRSGGGSWSWRRWGWRDSPRCARPSGAAEHSLRAGAAELPRDRRPARGVGTAHPGARRLLARGLGSVPRRRASALPLRRLRRGGFFGDASCGPARSSPCSGATVSDGARPRLRASCRLDGGARPDAGCRVFVPGGGSRWRRRARGPQGQDGRSRRRETSEADGDVRRRSWTVPAARDQAETAQGRQKAGPREARILCLHWPDFWPRRRRRTPQGAQLQPVRRAANRRRLRAPRTSAPWSTS